MTEYPIDKYKFYTDNKSIVIAVSTYEGKIVRGVAKTDPGDTFNFEKGRLLAAARCNQKISEKRKRRAIAEREKAIIAANKAIKHLDDMNDYYEDSRIAVKKANMKINELLTNM